jgi:hypothetical protein
LFARFRAQTLALCVAPPLALPARLMAASLVGLLVNFAQQALPSARGLASADVDSAEARAPRAWLALKLACELAAPSLACATRNGVAGATLLVAGHLAFNAGTAARIESYGGVSYIEPKERRRLVGGGVVMTALGIIACVSDATGPRTLALAASATFTAAAGGWLLYRGGRFALLWLLARAFAGQRC